MISIEFIFRIIGMIVLGILGVYLGIELGGMAGAPPGCPAGIGDGAGLPGSVGGDGDHPAGGDTTTGGANDGPEHRFTALPGAG